MDTFSWVTSFKSIEWDTDGLFCKTCEGADDKGLLNLSLKKDDNVNYVYFSN